MNFQEQILNKTDQELLDIYSNPGEYQEKFVDLAHQELIKRNVPLEKHRKQKESKSNQSNRLLEQGRKGNELYIALGFIFAALGGLIGIIAGYTYSQSKHDGHSGERYYVYNKQTRDAGRIMMILGIVVLLATMIWRFS